MRSIILFCSFILLSLSVLAQFPYTETFKKTAAPGIVFGGSATSFLTAGVVSGDVDGTGYLRLTDATNYQKGYIYGNTSFPTTFGLKASFEYFTYGGDGADGICFFLFDASVSSFSIGSFGGSLGYAQFNSPVSSGVSKAYLGIGLDEFGNFANPTEGRQGGPGFRANSVVLRGSGDGSAATATNYPYLTSRQTSAMTPAFNISGGTTRSPLPSSAGYRKVDLLMKPRTGGGYDITVDITVGGTTPSTYTVISSYAYTESAPSNLKFGFAGSTGGSTNYHEIRNLTIDVFDPSPLLTPTAKDTSVSACYGAPLNFNILSNAVLPNSPTAADSTSVRFITPGTGVKTNTLTIAGMGTFYTDTTFGATGMVTFTPASGFSGTVTPVQYTFKDNYGKQATNGTINVTVKPEISNNIISPAGTVNMYNGTLPTGGSGTFTYQWQYSTTDSISGFANGGGLSTGQNYTAPAVSDTTWYRRVVTSDGCSVYSNTIGVSASGVPLPLDLLSFDAKVQGSSVLLDWKTDIQNKLSEFTVQRSTGSLDWTAIGAVPANSNGGYSYTDHQPSAGINLYRLTMKDAAGISVYSSVRRVQMTDAVPVEIYPNPTSDLVYIRCEAPGTVTGLEIAGTDGRILTTDPPLSLPLKVDMSQYPSGLYFLYIARADGSKTILKLNKL